MSIVESLKKLLDPLQARLEEQERKSLREQPKKEVPGDPPSHVCRVCGHASADESYCPKCLADTMEPVKG